jgi:hypothetical protein
LSEGIEKVSINLMEDDFDGFCKNAHYIITSAYDGEGYIIWEKKKS